MSESTKAQKQTVKATKTAIEALQPAEKHQIHYVEGTRGLAVWVTPSGHKSFYLFYRTFGKGRSEFSKRIRLGVFPDMTIDQARKLAENKRADVNEGADPAKERQEARAIPTVADAWDEFFEEHSIDLKAHTISHYQGIIQKYVKRQVSPEARTRPGAFKLPDRLPVLGKMKIDIVTEQDITQLYLTMKKAPYMANRLLAVLSGLFTWCEKRGYRAKGTNPTSDLKKYKEFPREGFLNGDQLGAIGAAISTLEGKGLVSPYSAAALRLLLLTGARKNEVLSLKWKYLNLDRGTARLPDTKNNRPKTLHLPALAVDILRNLKDSPWFSGEDGFVFPSDSKSGHLADLRRPWSTVCKQAGLTGWRPHDMRHTFASVAASSDESLLMIGAQLGHTKSKTTEKYAHLANNPVHDMTERTGAKIAESWTKPPAPAAQVPPAENDPPARPSVH